MTTTLEDARSRIDTLRAGASDTERNRKVDADLCAELARAGTFRMLVPKSLGGLEVAPRVFAETLEALARGDAAVAWVAMTGSTTGLLSAYLPDEGAEAFFRDPAGIYAGVFAPMGRAMVCEGGFRLTGRWPFTSGVDNAGVRLGGALVFDEGSNTPRMQTLEDGTAMPEIRSCFVRADQSNIVDTWKTSGLRGTGSHDLVVEDVFVPAGHTAAIVGAHAVRGGAVHRLPLFGLLASGIASVGLGIARAALDEVKTLLVRKKPGRKSGAESELTQVNFARAEGTLCAARALLLHALDEAMERTAQGDPIDGDTKAALRLAATHAAWSSAEVVDVAYHLGGGAALYDKSPLQRHFRDVHTMTQHIMVAQPTLKPIGRILLGLPTQTAQL